MECCRIDPSLCRSCMSASILRYSLNPIARAHPLCQCGQCHAEKLTVRISYDECQTWNGGNVYTGAKCSLDLAKASDGTILCFYERGEEGPYEELRLAQFSLDWLTDDKTSL